MIARAGSERQEARFRLTPPEQLGVGLTMPREISLENAGRYGAHKGWAETVDRTARTAPGRRHGPGDIDWHLARLDRERFANATDAQKLQAAEFAKKAYYAELAIRSAKSRSKTALKK